MRATRSLADLVVPLGCFEFLDVLGRQLRAVHFDRQLVELGGEGEGRLVVCVVHAGQRVGPDVEALVPLQDHGQSALHLLRHDFLAVYFEHTGAGTPETAHVIECERAQA